METNDTTMKTLLPNYLLTPWLCALILLGFQSCDDNGAQPATQKVHFTFSASNPLDGGRAKDTELPEGARLKVSIQTSDGTPVFTDHELVIMKAGDSHMTDPVELMPGAYALTDFMIVNGGELA